MQSAMDPAEIGFLPILLSTGFFLSWWKGFQKFGPSHFNGAWSLTFLSSFVMTLYGLCFLPKLFILGPINFVEEVIQNETPGMRIAAQFFIGYMIADLIVCAFKYTSEFDVGWQHHTMYTLLLCVLLRWQLTGFFAACLLEELPTILLSWRRLNNEEHLEFRFTGTFFLMRIVLHTIMTYSVYSQSTLFFIVGLVLLRQHMLWFRALWKRHKMQPQRKSGFSFQMKLKEKIIVLCAMVALQIFSHLYVTWDFYGGMHGDYGIFSQFWFTLLHIVVFVYFTGLLISILVDTYSNTFIFDAIEEKTIIYNCSWEDPAIEIKALGFNHDDVILTISSAGCNVLDYLCEDPKLICAADLNIAQLAILDLKLAGIAAGLPWQDFFALWGRSDCGVFEKYYEPQLRALLRREDSRNFWDENGIGLFSNNFMYAGTGGLFAYLIMRCMGNLTGWSGYMARRVKPKFENKGVKAKLMNLCIQACSWPPLWDALAPLGGVPREQMNLIKGSIAVFQEQVHKILTDWIWAPDNYFYYGYVTGVFAPDCCPRYMSEKYYPKLKDRVNKVQLFHGTLANAAKNRTDWTVISVLDSMDWMPPKMVSEVVKVASEQLDRDKGQIFWRCFSPNVHSPALAQLFPKLIPDQDRVGWYLSQWVAKVPKDFEPKMLLPSEGPRYTNTLTQDLAVIRDMALQAVKKEKDVAAFYKSQAQNYDGFREALLPLRDVFMELGVPWTRPIKSWISVGCGTARDIEFVIERVRHWQTKVYLVDLSPELLKMAEKRVRLYNLHSLVTCIAGDFLSKEVRSQLPKQVDLVTCSYCLTMIPPWEAALKGMKDLLAPKGYLGLVDFTVGQSDSWHQRFCKWWFQNDGVYLNREHVNWLDKNMQKVWFHEESRRCPYNVIRPTSYIYVGCKGS